MSISQERSQDFTLRGTEAECRRRWGGGRGRGGTNQISEKCPVS